MNSRLLRAAVLACLLAAALIGTASAHADLVESDPADGETIETPYELRTIFSIELDPDRDRSFVVVRDASGAEVARGGVSPDDPTAMTVELPRLDPGTYLARWQAFDPTDTHAERGTISFTVAGPSPSPTPTPTRVPPRATPARTSAATGTPAPTPAPTPTPTPTPPDASPEPGDGDQAAGMTDALLALVLAGAVIGGLSLYLLRRR